MSNILFKNAHLVDGSSPEQSEETNLLVENGLIKESGKTVSSASAEIIDLKGKTLMPGLIDAHVHVIAAMADLGANSRLPDEIVTVRSLKIMHDMIHRGFTTVRDVGGATSALRVAAAEAMTPTPRLVISGNALCQTGGHTDYRGPYNDNPTPKYAIPLGALGRVCDGVDEVRRAVREEIKSGVDFIKVMANGGVSSPTDPIHFLGFSIEELKAIVEEAQNAGTYVSAHLYTKQAIRRAIECGVKSLEHCNLIDEATAKLAVEKGCIAVPTLVTYDKLASEGASMGLPAASIAKVDDVRLAGMNSLKIMQNAGLPMAYGSDLLGGMQIHQSEEFIIRARVLKNHKVIESATSLAAKLLRLEGKVGTLANNAYADLLVIDGDPLKDISLLTGQGKHMPIIMKGGRFVKRQAI